MLYAVKNDAELVKFFFFEEWNKACDFAKCTIESAKKRK